MKLLRFRAILLSCWLVLCFSAERFFDPMDISDICYMFVLTITVLILFAPHFVKIPLWAILASAVTIFLMIKASMGTLTIGTSVAITVMEVFAIIVTVLLSYWISLALNEFENAIAKITISPHSKMTKLAFDGQGYIYREVRRARNHQRPLVLMAIGVDEKSLKVSLDRMVQEVQLSMMKQYMFSKISRTLCDQLEDCAIIVQDDEHFLIALPETKPEEMPIIIERLRKQAAEQIGTNLKIGTAALPKDSFSFEGLVDKATSDMETNLESQLLPDLQKLPANKSMTAAK